MINISWSVADGFEKKSKYSNNYFAARRKKNEVLPAFFMAHKYKIIK